MMPLYVAFFNLIYNAGVLPSGNTAYIQKGDSKSPVNYRPIKILSYFTSILNARLNKFLDTIYLRNIRLVSAQATQQWIIFLFACINRNCKNTEKEIVVFVY